MKKVILFCFAVTVMVAAGCSKNELKNANETENNSRIVTISANADSFVTDSSSPYNAPTRVAVDNSGNFTWEAGDVIGVWTGSKITPFTLSSGEGSNTATFSGTLTGEETISADSYAVYPYDYLSCNGSEVTLNVNSSFWGRSAPTRLVPMFAAAGTGHTTGFSFKMLSTVAKFTIKNLPSEIIAIYLEAQLPADPRTIWLKNGSTADVTAAIPEFSGTGDEGYGFAIPPVSSSYESLDVYVPIMPGAYDSDLTFKIKMFKDTGSSEVSGYTRTGKLNGKSTTYERGQLLVIPVVYSGVEASVADGQSWASGATMALYNGSIFSQTLKMSDNYAGETSAKFYGKVPYNTSYAIVPALGSYSIAGTTLSRSFSRDNYPVQPVLYGAVNLSAPVVMNNAAATILITLQNVPVAATHVYMESWGGDDAAPIMLSTVETNLSTDASTYGAGINWAFAALPDHDSPIDVQLRVPLRPGTYTGHNWCICLTSNNAFGNEISAKKRYQSGEIPGVISSGEIYDLGTVDTSTL